MLLFSQLVSNEKNPHDESKQETPAEPPVIVRKQSSSSVDNRSNRKSMFEQSTTVADTHPVERVNSILQSYSLIKKFIFFRIQYEH